MLLLCAVQFLDFVDSSIVNVALPSIRRDLHFSQQNLQWVLSGYLLTYGGFLLLGGRAADLLGRRRLLVAGIVAVRALLADRRTRRPARACSIGARLVQGIGAAMMAPAGLSILTTTFTEGADRNKALGIWGAVSGLAAAAGVFLGGVLSEGPGWRWVLFVNLPICALVAGRGVPTARRLTAASGRVPAPSTVAARSSSTAGMLLLVYALVRAPGVGWGNAHTIGELATALGILRAVRDQRAAKPATRCSRSPSSASRDSPPPTPPS